MSEGEGEVERLLRRLGQERRARREAESLLARRSVALGEANRELAAAVAQLELTVDERTRALVDLRAVAYLDGLTGLANRRLFQQRLADAIARGEEGFALIFIDVDDFKRINDLYGHPCGDGVLRQIARRLLEAVREVDIVARVAGDEFAILIPGLVAREALARLTTRIVRAMTAPVELIAVERSVTVSLSVGVAIHPEDGTTAEALSVAADLAMYRSKQDGKNRVTFCDERIRRQWRQNLVLEQELGHALPAGELCLHYLPLVGQHDEDVTVHALEALLRWRHPRRGLLEASEFVPFADERAMMPALGRFVLSRAIEEARPWFDGPHPPAWLAVNVSARQLGDEGFLEFLDELLRHSGVAPDRIALDVSEGSLIDSPARALGLARRLKALGVRLCIDDFGSQFAGLCPVCDLRPDVLKLARELTCRIPGDAAAEALVETIVGLTRRLGILLVAEGVETPEGRAGLVERGIDHFQGYLFGPPLPAPEVPDCLVRGGLPAPGGACLPGRGP